MRLIFAVTPRGRMRFRAESGGVNAAVFIGFLKRLLAGSKHTIFLIVDQSPAHRAKTKAFVESRGSALRLYLPPYALDRNPDELVC